jgi:hypothetical protein
VDGVGSTVGEGVRRSDAVREGVKCVALFDCERPACETESEVDTDDCCDSDCEGVCDAESDVDRDFAFGDSVIDTVLD